MLSCDLYISFLHNLITNIIFIVHLSTYYLNDYKDSCAAFSVRLFI